VTKHQTKAHKEQGGTAKQSSYEYLTRHVWPAPLSNKQVH